MRGKGGIIAVVAVLIVVIVTLILIIPSNNEHNWYESYGPDDKEPYGGYVLSKMLKNHKGDEFVQITDTIYLSLDTLDVQEPATYFFYGNALYTDSAEVDWLLDFVRRGNTAFISSKRFNWGLFDTLFYQSEPVYWLEEDDPENYWDVYDYISGISDTSIVAPYGLSQEQEFKWIAYNHVYEHRWMYFQDTELANGEYAEELGTFNTTYDYGFINLIRIPFGDGWIYLHSTPETFTNYHLLEKGGFEYAREVFGYLPSGTLIWDDDNRYYKPSDTPAARDPYSEEGPLSFIQSEPALRAALYAVLFFILVYMLLGLRRKQRPIPVQETRANTSIEFSEVVSQLYLNQRDHRKLGMLKMKLFQAHVLERYGIRATGKEPEEMQAYAKRIAVKSNIAPEHLAELMDTYRELTVIYNVDNALLVRFHKQLEYFYQNCK